MSAEWAKFLGFREVAGVERATIEAAYRLGGLSAIYDLIEEALTLCPHCGGSGAYMSPKSRARRLSKSCGLCHGCGAGHVFPSEGKMGSSFGFRAVPRDIIEKFAGKW